jgi:plastocyanin
MKCFAYLFVLICIWAIASQASEVRGDIKLDTRIARKSVPAAIYDLRGMATHDQRAPATSRGAGGFARIAVWLEGGADSAAPATFTMQQHDRRFEPDLLIIPTGSKVLFPNLDPVFHNIFSLSPTQSFDLGYYAEGKSRELVFSRPGIVQIYCHVHPEMYGVIVVMRSRWTTRPASDGSFVFQDVPPGNYRVIVWQHAAGLVHKKIAVPSHGEVQVSFKLPDDESAR